MFYVVWCFKGQDPRAVFAIHGYVAKFATEAEARSFARKGHPMGVGRYRVLGA